MNDVNTEDTPVTTSVKVIASIAQRINLAFQQNAVPVIAAFRIENGPELELIAALVQRNDPSVAVVLRIASSKLSSAGRAPGIDGYPSGLKTRAWEIAEAIWAALVDQNIAYVLPPASFEQEGQKIRFPSDILDRKVGTCLDLTLLYAACLEQAGLNPVIVLTQGHAFAGVWLKDEDFSLPVI